MSSFKIVIIGNGPCGVALLHFLKDITPLWKVDIIEKDDHISDSPIMYNCGPQVISHNVYESNISSIFQNLERNGIINHIEDNLLSFITNERPHGWNRATGQWKHYHCIDRHKIFVNMKYQYSDHITYYMGKVLNSIEIINNDNNNNNEILLSLIDSNGIIEYMTCQKLIITTPAYETLRLIKTISISNVMIDILEVLERCSNNYDTRYCKTIHIKKDSDVGTLICSKFHTENIIEIDVTNIGQGDITLISLGNINDYNDKDSDIITLYLHAKSDVSLKIKYISSWISHWLNLECTESLIIDDNNNNIDDIKCFYQSKPCTTPLTPLKEVGCIEINDSIFLCGDYTVGSGTFSGAILAAYKTSKVVMATLL